MNDLDNSFAGTVIVRKNRKYYRCGLCGAWHQYDYGISVDWDFMDRNGAYWRGLCRACAYKVEPILDEALDKIEALESPKKKMSKLDKYYSDAIDMLCAESEAEHE